MPLSEFMALRLSFCPLSIGCLEVWAVRESFLLAASAGKESPEILL